MYIYTSILYFPMKAMAKFTVICLILWKPNREKIAFRVPEIFFIVLEHFPTIFSHFEMAQIRKVCIF